MNEKEVSELRRRLKPDKNNISQLCGCYVNEKREIISMFGQSMGLLPQEEAEEYLALLKKSLSGGLGRNLLDITFSTQQVVDSPEHKRLMALRDSRLKDNALLEEFFGQVISALTLEGQYLILLACDSYDVPYRGKDGETVDDGSSDQFSYILCSICPVKQTKPALSYSYKDNGFRTKAADLVVAAPEAGFLFPAFDDRATNLYNALYYTKDTEENHQELVDALFCTPLPMPAAQQKETFRGVLAETLGADCSYDVLQQVHEQLREKMEEHKAVKDPEPLTLSKSQMKDVLECSGVAEEHVAAFDARFEESFGENAQVCPGNVVDAKKFELRCPDVVIQVSPDRADLIETRIIDGRPYILVSAGEGVQVNGVNIHIAPQPE